MCLESLGLLLGSHMDHKEVAGLEFDPPPLDLFSCECALLCPFLLIVQAHKVYCCWYHSQSHLNWVGLQLALVSQKHCFH